MGIWRCVYTYGGLCIYLASLDERQSKVYIWGTWMPFCLYILLILHILSNSFVRSLLLDLEILSEIATSRNKTGHLPGIPRVALSSAALKQSALTLKMQHFPFKTQKKVLHVSLISWGYPSFSKLFLLCGCSAAVFTRVTQNGQHPSRAATLPPSELISSDSRELQPCN